MNPTKLKYATSIRFPPELKQYLLRLAFIEKRTLSNLVIKICEDAKEKKENT